MTTSSPRRMKRRTANLSWATLLMHLEMISWVFGNLALRASLAYRVLRFRRSCSRLATGIGMPWGAFRICIYPPSSRLTFYSQTQTFRASTTLSTPTCLHAPRLLPRRLPNRPPPQLLHQTLQHTRLQKRTLPTPTFHHPTSTTPLCPRDRARARDGQRARAPTAFRACQESRSACGGAPRRPAGAEPDEERAAGADCEACSVGWAKEETEAWPCTGCGCARRNSNTCANASVEWGASVHDWTVRSEVFVLFCCVSSKLSFRVLSLSYRWGSHTSP